MSITQLRGFPRRTRSASALVILCALAAPAWPQWQQVGPDIEYNTYTVAGPNNVYVARLDRSSSNTHIESSIGQGRLSGGRETVSGMAARYEDTIGFWKETWGRRNNVVVAVNGDFFNVTTGVPTSGQIHAGWYAKRFTDFTGGSGMVFQLDRDIDIGGCVHHRSEKNFVSYPLTGQTQNISGINVPPASHKLTLYTPQFDVQTDTAGAGSISEVIVQLDEPLLIKPPPAYVRGTVREIRQFQSNSIIPFDSVVIAAEGNAATMLLNNVSLGSEVRFSQEVTHYEHDCSTPRPFDWTKTYASIGSSFHFLADGVVQPSDNPGVTQRHPRTAVAFNNTYIYFIVVDGRSTASVGMSLFELGDFCIDYLNATEGVNQDGGGSSAMWVNGQIMNVPSDGTERTVANGLMMVVSQPRQQSNLFVTNDEVTTTATADVRLGPGTNYAATASVSASVAGTILDHPLNGVRAKGAFWWKCQFASAAGWVEESRLLLTSPRVPDFDEDGDIDLDDFGHFQACFTPYPPNPPPSGCQDANLDGDNDVDYSDLIIFMNCMSGPNIPVNPDCAN